MKLRCLFCVILAAGLLHASIGLQAQGFRGSSKKPGPARYHYLDQDYIVKIGGEYFWNKDLNGYLLNVAGEYFLKLSASSNWRLGFSAEAWSGGLALKNALYREPASAWQTGLKIRFKPSGCYDLSVGYGQNYLSANLATGLVQKLYSDYVWTKLELRFYQDRLKNQSRFFNQAGLLVSARFALKQDEFFWRHKPVNPDFLPQLISVGGDLAIVDLKLSPDLLLPVAVRGSVNQYGQPDLNFFSELTAYVDLHYQQRLIISLFVKNQNAVRGSAFSRYAAGVFIDFGWFIEKNN